MIVINLHTSFNMFNWPLGDTGYWVFRILDSEYRANTMASFPLPPASSLRPYLSSASPPLPFLRSSTGALRQSIHRKKFLVQPDEATVPRLVQDKRDAAASLNLKLIVSGSTSLAMLFGFVLGDCLLFCSFSLPLFDFGTFKPFLGYFIG